MQKISLLAAIFAAGLTASFAHAERAPDPYGVEQAKLEKAFAEQASRKGKGEEGKTRNAGGKATGTTFQRLGEGTPQPAAAARQAEADKGGAVDTTTTASIRPGSATPELHAKARKRVIDLDGTKGSAVVREAKSGKGGSYSTLIAKYAASYGVPVALAQAVVRVESNFRPNARGRAGEIGLMQIKPATARMMGYSGSAKGLFHPETNIKFGMKYLAQAHRLGGGSTCGTILKYNAGHGAKRMNRISAAYCAKVKRHIGA